jgi:exosortase/archaeosortase
MDQSKLTQSPLEREVQSFTRAATRAEEHARRGGFGQGILAICEALRSMSLMIGVVIKTVDMVVKENKALTERVDALEQIRKDDDAELMKAAGAG